MFRVTYQNNIQLSQLADGKANTLISINGVIISIVIALVSPRFDTMGPGLAAAIILLIGCTISLAFAVIASRPRIDKRTIEPNHALDDDVNLLFFGEFLNLSSEEFAEAMRNLIVDRNLVYSKMTRQIYSIGLVLEKKYLRLQIAYNIFLATLVMAVSLFLYASVSSSSGA